MAVSEDGRFYNDRFINNRFSSETSLVKGGVTDSMAMRGACVATITWLGSCSCAGTAPDVG
ncbi:hypothetical protein HSBAA_50780 [Vreelandella sulfidaeris]|uniref:Uncharacterized protein n=1 Tax=Vreelandella sulfidaeris TaxID=115553 RepID=A0A455UC26_9GAMM|nr:hypothetical protein HSBAA_50780 [Halomonas sulfidaeris]